MNNIVTYFPGTKENTLVIFVSTTNEQKLKAVYDAFSEENSCTQIIVKGLKTKSHVPEQPIDFQTKRGAITRLRNLEKFLTMRNIHYDYCVSLESGISKNMNKMYRRYKTDVFECLLSNHENEKKNLVDKFCFDFCCCAISNKQEVVEGISDETNITQIPTEFFNKCVDLKQKKTIGQVIHKSLGVDKNNWHEYYSTTKSTRSELMKILVSNTLEMFPSELYSQHGSV